jgi:hypothetical protein
MVSVILASQQIAKAKILASQQIAKAKIKLNFFVISFITP